MSGKYAEQMIHDAIKYGTGFLGHSNYDVFEFSEPFNPYSWTIRYFDDWRCIADFLRLNKEKNHD